MISFFHSPAAAVDGGFYEKVLTTLRHRHIVMYYTEGWSVLVAVQIVSEVLTKLWEKCD